MNFPPCSRTTMRTDLKPNIRKQQHCANTAGSFRSAKLRVSFADANQHQSLPGKSEETNKVASLVARFQACNSNGGATPKVASEKQLWNLDGIYPIIPGRLHFMCTPACRSPTLLSHGSLVTITSELPKQYFSFCHDFGPNNLAVVLRFCDDLSNRLSSSPAHTQFVFRASWDPRIRTNAAFLLASYLLFDQKITPEDAIAPFAAIHPYPFRGFRDATHAPVTFELSILDCLRGLARGMSCGWLLPIANDLADYEYWDHPAHGDMHRICPKLIAFKGPVDPAYGETNLKDALAGPGTATSSQDSEAFCFGPEVYVRPFVQKGVTAVIRLSEAEYDAAVFTRNGIRHYDLVFEDCSVPSVEQLEAFVHIVDKEGAGEAVVAVHCKAGLGRTGTMIAAWLMRRHGFSAREAIAWLRLCRPGSVIGPQQHFLVGLERHWQSEKPQKPSLEGAFKLEPCHATGPPPGPTGSGTPRNLKVKLKPSLQPPLKTQPAKPNTPVEIESPGPFIGAPAGSRAVEHTGKRLGWSGSDHL